MPDYLDYSSEENISDREQSTQRIPTIESILSNLYLLLVPLQAVVSLVSVLVLADRIPLQIVDSSEATLLSKGTRGGVTVGNTKQNIPFELVSNPQLGKSVILFLAFAFVTTGILYALSIYLEERIKNYPGSNWVYLSLPILYLGLLWISVALFPGIEFCYDDGTCQNSILFVNTPLVMLFPTFGGLQSLIVGLVAWVYKHDFVPESSTNLEHHLENWWKRIKSLNQLLLVLAVNLSIPFALNRTGLGLWAIGWTVITFGLAVSLILYFSFRKTSAIEARIDSR